VVDDPLEELAKLRDDLDVTAQKLDAVSKAAAGPFTGSDSTGSVSVAVDGSGRVQAVTVGREWRTELGVDRLGAAVIEAIHAAATIFMDELASGTAAQDEAADPTVRPAPLLSESLASELNQLSSGALTGDELQAGMAEMLSLLQTVNDSLDQVATQVTAFAAATHTGRSRSGHAWATVSGGGNVVDVGYNKRWLVNAHEFNVSRETREAFEAAYRAVRQETGVRR
jgi:DNA-binding protein YbaB